MKMPWNSWLETQKLDASRLTGMIEEKNQTHINAKCKCTIKKTSTISQTTPGGGLTKWSHRLSKFLSRRTSLITERTVCFLPYTHGSVVWVSSVLIYPTDNYIITLFFSRCTFVDRFPASTSTSIFWNTSKMYLRVLGYLRSKA